MSTLRRESAKTIRSPDGTILCSCGCGGVPKPPRRTWFSKACVNAWREKNDPAYIRQQVFKRDRGICDLCGCDAVAAYRAWQDAAKQASRLVDWLINHHRWNQEWHNGAWQFTHDPSPPDWKAQGQRRRELMAKWMPPGQWTEGRKTGWDADHINPVVMGGGLCDLSNIRTLCHCCHKAETKKLAGQRATARRMAVVTK